MSSAGAGLAAGVVSSSACDSATRSSFDDFTGVAVLGGFAGEFDIAVAALAGDAAAFAELSLPFSAAAGSFCGGVTACAGLGFGDAPARHAPRETLTESPQCYAARQCRSFYDQKQACT